MNEPRSVRVMRSGPVLIEGPVRIELPDGTTVQSDRFMVAVCTCRRSLDFPFCDTSHRACRPGQSNGRRSEVSPSPQQRTM